MRYYIVMSYYRRVIDTRVQRLLQAMGGVVLEGPRGCGKTSTGLQHAHSSIRLDASPSIIDLAELDPASLLQGETPRLIDEWQLAPILWNAIRHEIDDRQAPGQFILSGSATPPDDIRRHSGAGRFARIRMRPMSLSESGRSSAQVSLHELNATDRLSDIRSPLSFAQLAVEATRGGWPGLVETGTAEALDFNASYCADIASTDLRLATGTRHDPVRVRRLLASLARNIASEATVAKLSSDVAADGKMIDRDTIRNYLDALTTIFIFEEQPAWSASLRSRTRLRSQPKLHFSDPSLACAALQLSPERLASDPAYFGQIFESMVIRDLKIYLDADGGELYHYRDETGLEIDAIAEFADGGWAAIEVKLGAKHIPAAEAQLLSLRDNRVNLDRLGKPKFLAIITGTEYGYTLPSGIHVIPLGTLTA
ncbi:MAG: DUF4143 domain-containing protein [Propionibacteriaceae bacterium]|jgi:predicted AAA+ superfamily ATPase|nr:DUF4143 domain-containing protein [Propionibacteriaceae bacterium]